VKRFFLILAVVVLTILIFSGCSEKDNNNPNDVDESYAYNLGQFLSADDFLNLFSEECQEDILEDNIDVRTLFSALVSDEGGWNWHTRNIRDLTWEEFAEGYLIPDNEGRVYFENYSAQGINTYNVKYAETVDIYRAFQLVKPDETIAVYNLNGLDTELVDNHDDVQEAAIDLSAIVPDEITAIDSVVFQAADGYQKTYTPEEFVDGYWLINSQKTIFPSFPDMSGSKKKFKFLEKIIIFGDLEMVDEPAFGNYADESDLQFAFPEDLSEFDYIIWE